MNPSLPNAHLKSVVILIGPKGSGKTYIGKLLEHHLGISFLRVEPIFLENIGVSSLTGVERDAEGYKKVAVKLAEVVMLHDTVVIESTGASEAFAAFLKELYERYRVLLVKVKAPLDRCLERVRTRDNKDHIPVSDSQVLEINEKAALVRLSWDFEFDNSGPAPDDLILQRFREGLDLGVQR